MAKIARPRGLRSGQEELHHILGQGRQPRGAIPHLRPGWWLGEATRCPRSGAVAERSNPTSKEQWLHGRRRAKRSYSTFKIRRGSCEEIPTPSKVRSNSCALLEQP